MATTVMKVGYGVAVGALVVVTVWALSTRTSADGPDAPTYYVAPDGDDAGPGMEDAPWASLQKAADSAVPGSTVYVRGGTYTQRMDVHVSGTPEQGPITFENAPGEHVILDGSGLEVPAGQSGMISVESQHDVTIRGFDVTGYRTDLADHNPVGILVSGEATDIVLDGNHVHDMGTTFDGASGGDAFGIAVYGTSASRAITDLVIRGNEVDHLTLGSSESLVVNGNVDGFEIVDNIVHDNNNIGIDAIGFEGTAPDPSVDQARNGVIRGNQVYNIDSYGNPAYGRSRSANGIYVDGGRDILVEANVIHDVNIGMEFASEHAGRSTRNVTARNNLVYDATAIGLAIGGYDRRRGNTEDCVIVNNTFSNSADVELLVQFDTRNNVIENNIVQAGPGAVFLENPYEENEDNRLDHNVYYSAAGKGGTWQWKNVRYGDFGRYVVDTGMDRHSIYADPAFVDPASGDFSLMDGSPAIDAGAFLFTAGTADLAGGERLSGGLPDVGAIESQAPSPAPTPSLSGSFGYVSDLELLDTQNGWGPVEQDMSNGERKPGDGVAITLGGETFGHGLGVHAPSSVTIDLAGACTAFVAAVGVDDEVGSHGSVSFQVLGDGDELFRSPVMLGPQGSYPVSVDVSGVQSLELRVTPEGNVAWDHADWADARLYCGG
jgi:hypothetical protein